MASSHNVHGGDVHTDGATDGVVGPLSRLFATTTESQIPSHDNTTVNNDDNDNGQNVEHVVIDNNLTTTQASDAIGTIGQSNNCEVDQVADAKLHRWLERPENIRVELTLKKAAEMYLKRGPDVVEVFSQPRICQEASGRGLTPGWSLDLTMKDPATGRRWDLSDKRTQDRVRRLVRETEPYCIIGSPPCTPFSQLQELSRAKRDPKVMKKELEDAKGHIRLCMELYRMQLKARRHFVHEHPETSRAWQMPEVVDMMMQLDGATHVRVRDESDRRRGNRTCEETYKDNELLRGGNQAHK